MVALWASHFFQPLSALSWDPSGWLSRFLLGTALRNASTTRKIPSLSNHTALVGVSADLRNGVKPKFRHECPLRSIKPNHLPKTMKDSEKFWYTTGLWRLAKLCIMRSCLERHGVHMLNIPTCCGPVQRPFF